MTEQQNKLWPKYNSVNYFVGVYYLGEIKCNSEADMEPQFAFNMLMYKVYNLS
jgi:hypothetical protein